MSNTAIQFEILMQDKTKAGVQSAQANVDALNGTINTQKALITSLEKELADLQAAYGKVSASSGLDQTENIAQIEALKQKIESLKVELLDLNAQRQKTEAMIPDPTPHIQKFNGLNMSIQQVARELPTLAMGPQMFMLAISNNLPILSDQIKIAKNEYTALTAAGQKATPVWKQVVSSLFSWQTALVAGITLMIVFMPKIVEWVSKLKGSNNQMATTIELQKKLNETLEKSGDDFGKQITNLKKLQDGWNKLGGSLREKKKFINDNKDAFQSLGVSVTSVSDAENLLVKNTSVFVEALKSRAKAAAAGKLAEEAYGRAFQKEQEARLKRQELEPKIQQIREDPHYNLSNLLPGLGRDVDGERNAIERALAPVAEIEKARDVINQEADAYFRLRQEASKAEDAKLKAAQITPVSKPQHPDSSENKALKAQQWLANKQKELSNERIKAELETEQRLLDIQQDSFDKRLKQNDLNYRKELLSIKEFEAQKAKEQQEAAKQIYIKQHSGSEKGFDFSKFDTSLLPEELTPEFIEKRVNELIDIAKKTWANADELTNTESLGLMKAERLEFASELDNQIASIKAHYREKKKLYKTDSLERIELTTLEYKAIDQATLEHQAKMLQFEAEYSELAMEISDKFYLFQADKDKEILTLRIKNHKEYIALLEQQSKAAPNNIELANTLKKANLELEGLNIQAAKAPKDKFREISGYAMQIAESLSQSNESLGEMVEYAGRIGQGFSQGGLVGGIVAIASTVIDDLIKKSETEAAIRREIQRIQEQYNIDLRSSNYEMINSIDYARALRDNIEALQWLVEKGFVSNIDYSAWDVLGKKYEEANKNLIESQKNSDKLNESARIFLEETYHANNKKFKEATKIAADWKNGIISTADALRLLDSAGYEGMTNVANNIEKASEETLKWTDQLIDLSRQMDEFVTGTNFDGFLNSAMSAIDDYRKGISDAADFTEEALTNAILSSFKYKVLSNALEPFYNRFADLFLTDELDKNAINKWGEDLNTLVKEYAEKLGVTFDSLGIDDNMKSSSQSGRAGEITTITQEQASKLEGLATSIQIHTANMDTTLVDIWYWMNEAESVFREIADNTAYCKRLDEIADTIAEIKRDGLRAL